MSHRILIVDELDAERGALQRYLGKSLGYDVSDEAGAAKALEQAMAKSFDLAIISTGLKQQSGIETYMRLRSIQPELQAIFLAGEEEISETDRDFLRFSIPEEQVVARPNGDYSGLTRLIIGILGPPVV